MKKNYLFILIITMSFFLLGCEGFGTNSDNHKWGEWTIVKEATCSEKGSKISVCKECGETKEAAISMVEHIYSDHFSKTENGHYRECIICSKYEMEQHTPISANQHGRVRCSECNYLIEKGDISFYDNVESTFRNLYQLKMDELFLEVIDNYSEKQTLVIEDAVVAFDFADLTMIYIKGNAIIEEAQFDYISETARYLVEILISGNEVYIKADIETPNTINGYMGGCHYIKANMDDLNIFEEIGLYLNVDQIKALLTNKEINEAVDVIINKIYSKFGYTKGDVIELLINEFFNEENINEKTEFTLKFDYIMKIIDHINDKTIKELYENVFGKGKYDQLISRIGIILNMKVGVLLDTIDNKIGIEIDDLINLINVLKETLPDISSSINDLKDILEYLKNKEFREKTVYELLTNYSNDTSYSDVVEGIKEILIDLKDSIPLALNDTEYNLIKDMVKYLNESINVKLIADNSGLVEKITVNIDFDSKEFEISTGLNINLKLNMELSKVKPNFDSQKLIDEVNAGVELLDFEQAILENGNIQIEDELYTFEYSEEYKIDNTYSDIYIFEITMDMSKAMASYLLSSCGNEVIYSIYVPIEVYRVNKTINKDTNGVYLETTSSYEEEYIYFIYDTETKKLKISFDFSSSDEHDFEKISQKLDETGTYMETYYECSKCHEVVIEKFNYYYDYHYVIKE